MVEDQANRLMERIQGSDRLFVKEDLLETDRTNEFTPVLIQNMYFKLEKTFDYKHGGFGGAPKFPGTMTMQYLLDYFHHHKHQPALDQVILSLEKMIRGGIYDQLGGGFARYATDAAWLIPHFEKMLYDNALLLGLMSDAYTLTKKPLFAETIEHTLNFIEREMTNKQGGFFAALDADSEGEEGKFYVWNKKEVEDILGEEAALFCNFYDVTEAGNWEGNSILWRAIPMEEFATEKNMDLIELKARLAASRQKLFDQREKRIRPGRDEKVILAWNALQCNAYAKAYQALGKEAYRSAALKNLQFIFSNMQKESGLELYHTYAEQNGKAVVQYDAFLDDYAFLIEALISVYEITFDVQWLEKARQYVDLVLTQFGDEETDLFFYTRKDQTDIILRKKEVYDSAQPSGNSTMAINLLKLAALMGEESLKERAVRMLQRVREAVERYPSSFSRWARAMGLLATPLYELAVVGPEAVNFARELQSQAYLPNKVIMASMEANEAYPLLAGRSGNEVTKIFVCQDYTCQMPVSEVAAALEMARASSMGD